MQNTLIVLDQSTILVNIDKLDSVLIAAKIIPLNDGEKAELMNTGSYNFTHATSDREVQLSFQVKGFTVNAYI